MNQIRYPSALANRMINTFFHLDQFTLYHHSPGEAVTYNRIRCLVLFRNDSSVAIMGKPRSLFLAGALSIQRESDKQCPAGQGISLSGWGWDNVLSHSCGLDALSPGQNLKLSTRPTSRLPGAEIGKWYQTLMVFSGLVPSLRDTIQHPRALEVQSC